MKAVRVFLIALRDGKPRNKNKVLSGGALGEVKQPCPLVRGVLGPWEIAIASGNP